MHADGCTLNLESSLDIIDFMPYYDRLKYLGNSRTTSFGRRNEAMALFLLLSTHGLQKSSKLSTFSLFFHVI